MPSTPSQILACCGLVVGDGTPPETEAKIEQMLCEALAEINDCVGKYPDDASHSGGTFELIIKLPYYEGKRIEYKKITIDLKGYAVNIKKCAQELREKYPDATPEELDRLTNGDPTADCAAGPVKAPEDQDPAALSCQRAAKVVEDARQELGNRLMKYHKDLCFSLERRSDKGAGLPPLPDASYLVRCQPARNNPWSDGRNGLFPISKQ